MSLENNLTIGILLALAVSVSEAFGQYYIKSCSDCNLKGSKKTYKRLVYGLMFYMILCIILYKSYTYTQLGHMNLVWSCISIILAFLSGYYFFGEELNGYTYLSIFFALCAIFSAHLSHS
jgi:multidrug transporter EmrE-like cation transporter